MPQAVELSEVLGINARAIRGPAKLDDVARAARSHGANWTPGKVSDLEHGRVSPTVQTLVITALALSDVCGRNVFPDELLESKQSITLAKGFDVTSDDLKAILFRDNEAYGRLVRQSLDRLAAVAREKSVSLGHPRLRKVSVGLWRQVSADYGEPEQLLERELDIDRDRLIAEMAALWGKSFHAERDERAGSGANAQKKGRVSRALKAELRAVLDGDD
jgi:hypothetical protein